MKLDLVSEKSHTIKRYKVSTNQPFFLARTREKVDLDFLGNLEYCDAIILVCADIFGDSFIDEISKLTQLIKLYPPEVPCYLIGAKTRVPNYNFAYYRSSKRDVAINEFIDEIMRRSTAILVTDKITKDWLISEFGCDIKRVLSFTGEKIEESDILKTFEEFCKKII